MTGSRRNIVLALLAVALVQSAVLAFMVYDRVQLLKTGREIVLKIVPVDPRSIFRGDYVQLSYPISTVSADIAGELPKGNAPVYVTLERAADGAWKALAVRDSYQKPGALNQIVLKARSRYRRFSSGSSTRPLRLRYGIERYYVEEGKGPRLEKLAREKQLAALVAVDANGNAAIKGLMIDGKLQYEEPLF